jgi:hypothetical protein
VCAISTMERGTCDVGKWYMASSSQLVLRTQSHVGSLSSRKDIHMVKSVATGRGD